MKKHLRKITLTIGVLTILGGILYIGNLSKTSIVAGLNPPRTQQFVKEMAGLNPPRTSNIIKLDGLNPPRRN